jgi:Sulfotransferase family
MIINNTCQFIFVHVPKAAGTSLTNHLSKFSRYCDLEIGGTMLGEALQPEFKRRYGLSKHSSAMEIRETTGDEIWQKYFTFGFVRNPYERAFSIFHFAKKMSVEQQHKAYTEMQRYSTFAEFIKSDFYQTEGPDRIFNPQLFWLRQNASTDDIGVDFVGHVEEMNACVRELTQKLGQGMENSSWEDVPWLNESGSDRVTVWDELADHQELQEIVHRRNEIDFRVFGYEHEPIAKKKFYKDQ